MMRRLAILVALSLAALCCRGDEFSLGGRVELRGFHTNGENRLRLSSEDGGDELVKWRISGAKARLELPLVALSGFRMTIEGERSGTFVIDSPSCLFDRQRGEVRSPAAVQVTGPMGADGQPRCRLSGIGYDLLWRGDGEPLVLVVRSAVWLEFDQKLMESR